MHRLLNRLPVSVVGGIVGVLIGLGLIHAYYDHKALHDLVNLVNAQAAKK